MPGQQSAIVNTRPRIKVNHTENTDMAAALLSLEVNMPPEGMDAAELRLINWGGASGADSDYLFQDVRLGDPIDIELGGDDKALVFTGEITAFEERYGEGAPHIVLFAEDALHKLARKRKSRTFEDTSVNDLVSTLAQEAGLSGDANVSTLSRTFHQLNESDLAMLRRVLAPFNVAPRVDGTKLRAKAPEPAGDPPTIDPHGNGVRVRIMADLNRRVHSVKVAGYDVKNGQEVSKEVQELRPSASGTTAFSLLSQAGWEGDVYLPLPFTHNQTEANDYAQAGFNRWNAGFVRGDVTCEGNPALATGGQIQLAGVAERLRGTYGITHCVHRYDLQRGYETFMRIARADLAA